MECRNPRLLVVFFDHGQALAAALPMPGSSSLGTGAQCRRA